MSIENGKIQLIEWLELPTTSDIAASAVHDAIMNLCKTEDIGIESFQSYSDALNALSERSLREVIRQAIGNGFKPTGIAESAPAKINLLGKTVQDISREFLDLTKKEYKDVAGKLVMSSDGGELYTEVKGEDKIYSTLDLKTGEVQMLGEAKKPEVKESLAQQVLKKAAPITEAAKSMKDVANDIRTYLGKFYDGYRQVEILTEDEGGVDIYVCFRIDMDDVPDSVVQGVLDCGKGTKFDVQPMRNIGGNGLKNI